MSPRSAEPPARGRAEPSRGTRCLGAGSAPPDYTCRAGGCTGGARLLCTPAGPDVHPQLWPQPRRTPRSELFTCAAWPVAPCGERQSPPCRGLAGAPAQTRLSPGLWLSLARVLRQERQSPSAERVRSRLAAGPGSSWSIRSFPRAGGIFRARAPELAVPRQTPPRPSPAPAASAGTQKPLTQLRKQLKAYRGVARTLHPSPRPWSSCQNALWC